MQCSCNLFNKYNNELYKYKTENIFKLHFLCKSVISNVHNYYKISFVYCMMSFICFIIDY